MLVDSVTITVSGGRGGNGALSFKHLPKLYKGGPDGGNGGNGGDVYVQGVDDILALSKFRNTKEVKAEDAVKGGKNNLYGRNGKDITFFVPLGTIITDTETLEEWEITNVTTPLLLAKGGKGGRGNNEFKTATNQAPRFAEKGLPGQQRVISLNMRLIADIGLIGLPNAGKSSLLSVLTHATPKIRDYPFTTLEPNIGMMDSTPLADIPGLIEGASDGKGLGINFLRHVEKTKLLVHCIESTNTAPLNSYQIVRNELKKYNPILVKKPEIILITKIDMVDETTLEKIVSMFKKKKKQVYTITLYDDKDVIELKNMLSQKILNSKSNI